MLTHPSIVLFLRRHHLFSQLPEPVFEEVCAQAMLRRLASHGTLMHQGDPAKRFFLLVSGQVKLYRISGEGQENLVEIIQPGQTFAEALLFSQARFYPVNASALKDSVLISIDGNHYRHALEDQPQVCLAILASMSVHLHQRLKDIDTLTLGSASRRVVSFLLQERDPRSGEVVLQVSKRLVASKLGIQPETFSRILHRLVDSGLIAMERRTILILGAEELAAYDG
ncbi:Crp/Fnr family transcriptional regulator [Pseudomonas chlororaphis]|uniref:Crp/Fnr family transcriptional regulator n=1 Tax=Pseudomonas chlororaphis TaxID=587753 RepID=UPI0007B38632|nr:Crp/Fnr family transcriptional regulator [Pseudomonas chlororaphis]AZC51205.1 Nitric oxide -responding transcriptional regulator Dnr (Crp/Fnr family) [Pseudomonas chlororaphis subsp. piscium]AZC57779.1 Nitric oxide -responding transcriptional regulator Dnr (Crp/Fnr family) [Pseudomonas chlororaphis subsp. piscium]AZC64008.1 Nitric oxide -responding transcriptional regulator Dnr (Crp/Fnr family) [Pseudomonas chlororaphis subsp. piscium]AZC70231.1 Nitric oxide -responding transcriptional regul